MPITLPSAPIDQFDPYNDPVAGDLFVIFDTRTGGTKKIDIKFFYPAAPSSNYQWIPGFDYAEGAVVNHLGKWYISLDTPNVGKNPATEPAFWEEQIKSSSGFVVWAPGVFTGDHIFVLYDFNQDDTAPDWGIYSLIDAARPYNSIDFEAELAAGDWELFGGAASGLSDVLAISNNGGGLQIKNIANGSASQDAVTFAQLSAIPQHFRGQYTTVGNLTAAVPVGAIGDYAYIDAGVGSDVLFYTWDSDDVVWKLGGSAPVPDSSTTVKGKIEIATDAEVITGTDTVRSVVPSSLAAWWTAIKAAAVTWAGQFTFTLSPIVSALTATKHVRTGGSKELITVDSALPADVNLGTDDVKPVTSLSLQTSKYETQYRLRSFTTSSSAANAYAANLAPAITTYGSGGLLVGVKCTNANTGAATMALNGLSALAMIRPDGSPLKAGDIPAGGTALLQYTGTALMLLNPAFPVMSKSLFALFAVSVVGGSPNTVTLDMDSEYYRTFVTATAITAAFTLSFSNTTNRVHAIYHFNITGANIPISLPSTARMADTEKAAGRWSDSTRILTLSGTTATPFTLQFMWDGSIYRVLIGSAFI